MEKVIIIIRDGYGHRDETTDNAVLVGKTPFTDQLMEKYPTTLLRTSGIDVGLPPGYMGGSEVGHLAIGTGRITDQALLRINKAIEDKSFFSNPAFLETIEHVKKNNSTLHLMGLLQNNGIHSHQNHLFALLELASAKGVKNIVVHIFSDGRDTPAKSAAEYIEPLEAILKKTGGVIGTLIGRFYAMDRDTRVERTTTAYNLLVEAQGKAHKTIHEALADAYASNETDEFITPRVIGNYKGIADKDAIITYNYRSDRMRQITHMFLDENHDQRSKKLQVCYCTMQQYYDEYNGLVAFRPHEIKNTLADVIADNNYSQLHISETEKYPHVTFFFNGLIEEPKKREDRILIPSPRDVKTYDEKPEMSIFEIKDALIAQIQTQKHELIVVNYVNGDMVGHTGKMDAAVKAVEAIDVCIKETVEAALQNEYTLLIFADHGNCEEMAGIHQTSHTLNDVDCILVSQKPELQKERIDLSYGGLCDIAPTALEILNIKKPIDMTGKSLIKKK